jgi:general stress protein 26
MEIDRLKQLSAQLGPYAHCATTGADGLPDVSPIHPAWEGETLWFLTRPTNVKVRNIRVQPMVALHWQVTAEGNGLALWGRAEVFDDIATKRRLWHGVFDYDLNLARPGGPDNSPETVFVAIHPERAVYMPNYGAGPRDAWPE